MVAVRATAVAALVSASLAIGIPPGGRTQPASAAASPIRHVIVIDLENHSFDDVLGKLCVEHHHGTFRRDGADMGCDGARSGVLSSGRSIALSPEPNIGVKVSHSVRAQLEAIDGGAMDGFSRIPGCRSTDKPPRQCYVQLDPRRGDCGASATRTCIPNIAAYARAFAISDRTFELRATPSWAGHMVLGSATIERFTGWNPTVPPGAVDGPGWGCDSGETAPWRTRTGRLVDAPSCVPDAFGDMGPRWPRYRHPHAHYVPTIFDRMQRADISWRIYSGDYNWAICPTFWACRGSSQFSHVVRGRRILADSADDALPSVSFVIPPGTKSSHPPGSMATGDNWLGHVVGAVMGSADWASTAIFITWDDCGCFYDHVDPWQYSRSWGVRVPLLIVSPYARAGFTDHHAATFASLLTFIERTFSLPALRPCDSVGAADPRCTDDATGPHGSATYGYRAAFDYSQHPIAPLAPMHTALPPSQRRWMRHHRGIGDEGT